MTMNVQSYSTDVCACAKCKLMLYYNNLILQLYTTFDIQNELYNITINPCISPISSEMD